MPTDPTRTDAASSGDGAAPKASVPHGVDGPDAPLSGDGGPAETPGAAPRRRGPVRRAGRVLGFVGLGLVLVVAGALIFLQTGAGRSLARGLVVQQIANVFADDVEVSAETLAGSFLSGARLTGLEVRRDGEVVVAVDTVLVDYNLTTLLRRTFSASDLMVSGARVVARQRADSTFNMAGLLKPADPDKGPSDFGVRLDRVIVRRSQADVIWYRAEGIEDSVHSVRDLNAIVTGFRQRGDSLSGSIEALSLRALAPLDRGEAVLTAAGDFSKRDLSLTSLAVRSTAGTDLRGRARLQFTGDGALPVFDANVEATPLALEDARAFAGVQLYGDPRLRLRADSDGGLLTATLSGALDDATIALNGEVSRETDGPVRYRAEGTLQRFNPSVLTGNPALAAEVTGDVQVNLQGTTLETLSGPFNVALRETRVGQRQIDRLALDGSFAAGRVTFTLDGSLPGATLTAEGRARPFDDLPTVQVAGTAQDVDLGVLLPGSGRTDAFAGEFAVVGRGNSVNTFSGTVALDLTRADIGLPDRRLRFSDARVDADVDRGLIEFDADVALAGDQGRIVALGALELGDPLNYAITDGEAYGLNLEALTGNPSQNSDLTGSFTLDGSGIDLTQAPIDLTAQLRGSRYGEFDLAAADLDVELRQGVATLEAALDFGPGGQATAVGTARPFAQPLSYDLRGTMTRLDLAEVQGIPERYSDLTGTYVARGAGLDPATLTLDAQVAITEPSSYGERLIDSADLAVTLDNGFLTVNGPLRTPEGAFTLALTGRPFDETQSFAFDGTCFSDLDVSDFSETAPRTDLNGCFSGRLAGLADLPTADADGVITLRPSRINDAEIDDGTLRFTLTDGSLDGALDLAFPPTEAGTGGRVVADVTAQLFTDLPTYSVRGRTEALDVVALLDLPPDQQIRLSLDFDVAGRGTDPETMTLSGAIRGASSTLGPVTVDTLATRFALADGIVRVDTLRLASDLADASGGGTLALFAPDAASDFRLDASVRSLAPLAASTNRVLGLERGTLTLHATAEAGGPLRLTGSAEARQLVVGPVEDPDEPAKGEIAVTGLNALIDASWDRTLADSLGLGALSGGVRASFDVLSGPTYRVEQGTAILSADAGDFVIDASVRVDDRRDLDVYARIDPTTRGVVLETGRFQIDDQTWRLLQPSEIAIEDGLYDVRGLLLASDNGLGQIAADGQVDLQGEQNFVITAEGVPIDGLTDFVNLDALGGDLSATLDLTGPANAPRIDGRIGLADLTSRGEPVGALQATVNYADGRLGLNAVLTHIEGETLTVDGTIPLQFSLVDGPTDEGVAGDEQVALRARAQAFPIDWARPFLDDRAYNALGGTLRLDLTISGTQAAPELAGSAELQDGRLGVVATGVTYEPVQADVTFSNDQIELESVRILNEEGETALDVTGTIRLRELSVGELDLTITPRDFLAMDTRTYDALVLDRGTTPMRLTGTLDRPVLRGSVVLAQGDIYLTDELVPPELATVELTPAQIREVESRFGRVVTARDTATSRFVDALDYALSVDIQQNVWLRSKAGLPFDIEFRGQVDARKPSFAESSRLFGTIDLVRGSVETLNRQFELQRGSIQFNGDPLAARVDLSANLDIRLPGSIAGQSSVTITLSANGQLDDNPAIRLSSNPTMEAADIVSLIATGRLADEFVGTGALAGAGTNLALGTVSGFAEGLASETLGLELAQIDYEGGDLVIKFGDYLSSKLFWTAGVIVPLGQTSQGEDRLPILLSLDYELLKWLSAQTEYSGQRGVGAGLNYEVAW